MMLILAVDTTTPNGSAALLDGRQLLAETAVASAPTHSAVLLRSIDHILAIRGVTARDIEAFAVAAGPGSFTGIRIGLSTIKALAFASNKPAAAVSSLRALSLKADADEGAWIAPLLDARKEKSTPPSSRPLRRMRRPPYPKAPGFPEIFFPGSRIRGSLPSSATAWMSAATPLRRVSATGRGFQPGRPSSLTKWAFWPPGYSPGTRGLSSMSSNPFIIGDPKRRKNIMAGPEIGEGCVIRRMRVDDLPAVLSIETVSFPNPWNRIAFIGEIQNTGISFPLVVSAEGDRRIIGYAVYWKIADDVQINNIAVHPEFRGRSLGDRLLAHILETVKAQGARVVALEVRPSNTSAISLYRKHGFTVVGKRRGYYSRPPEDADVMMLKFGG
jgi:[ribosomal protein S18]-alanine N-acetyltransferase